jgi:hypothetical protein
LLLAFGNVKGHLGQLQVPLGPLLLLDKKFSSLVAVKDTGGITGFDGQIAS